MDPLYRLHAGLFFVVGCLLAERDRLTYCTLVCVSSLRTTVRFCLSAHASCFRESDIRFNWLAGGKAITIILLFAPLVGSDSEFTD